MIETTNYPAFVRDGWQPRMRWLLIELNYCPWAAEAIVKALDAGRTIDDAMVEADVASEFAGELEQAFEQAQDEVPFDDPAWDDAGRDYYLMALEASDDDFDDLDAADLDAADEGLQELEGDTGEWPAVVVESDGMPEPDPDRDGWPGSAAAGWTLLPSRGVAAAVVGLALGMAPIGAAVANWAAQTAECETAEEHRPAWTEPADHEPADADWWAAQQAVAEERREIQEMWLQQERDQILQWIRERETEERSYWEA